MADTEEREESHGVAAGLAIGGLALGGALAVGGVVALMHSRQDSAADTDVPAGLAEMNATDERRLSKLPDPATRSCQRTALLIANSLDLVTASKLLDEPASKTAERVSARVLYGFRSSQGLRIPAFQFSGGLIVRHLDRVLPRLREDLHPLEVMNWFHGNNPDLRLDGEQVSPVEWLTAGRDPVPVMRLAGAVGRPS